LQLLGASRDAAGGVLVGWSREAPADSEMFEPLLTRVANVSNVGVPTLATLPALALSAPAPNPARTEALIRCTLPRAEVARLELVDLAGRRVHSRTFSGAGIHTERLTGLDRLAPGLYFLTLVQGGASSVRRIAIVH
jgi:hypothetical protein